MTEIRLIRPDTELPELKPLDWDVVINHTPYYVVRIEGYVHTIGGRWGDNDYWAYPRNEKPSYSNLIEFNCDCPVCWGVRYDHSNYTKCKWDETSARTGGHATITRNGKDFYSVTGTMQYAMHKAMMLISEIEEHPLELCNIDFDKKMIGRKVWWRSEPAVITMYTSDGCVILEPDGIDAFTVPAEFAEEDPDYYEDGCVKADLFDKHVWWFRD